MQSPCCPRSHGKSPATKPYIAFGNPLLTGPYGTNKRAWAKQSSPKNLLQAVVSACGVVCAIASLFRGGLGNIEELRRQSPLPETADELCAVAHDLMASESDVYLGARATERTIKDLSKRGDLISELMALPISQLTACWPARPSASLNYSPSRHCR
jgi:hypothetical protein